MEAGIFLLCKKNTLITVLAKQLGLTKLQVS